MMRHLPGVFVCIVLIEMTAMFEAHRIFVQTNPRTGLTEWFFKAREGVFGPYSSEELAVFALHHFVAQRVQTGDDGGRSEGRVVVHWFYDFSPAPIEHSIRYDPIQKSRERGWP